MAILESDRKTNTPNPSPENNMMHEPVYINGRFRSLTANPAPLQSGDDPFLQLAAGTVPAPVTPAPAAPAATTSLVPDISDLASQAASERSYFQSQQASKLQELIKLIDPKAAALTFPDGSTPQDQLQITLKALSAELAQNKYMTDIAANSDPRVRAFFDNPTATDAAGLKNLDATLAALQNNMSTNPVQATRDNALKVQTIRGDLSRISADQSQDTLAKDGLEPLFKQLLPGTDIQGTSQAERDTFMLKALQDAMKKDQALLNLSSIPGGAAIANFLSDTKLDGISADAISAIQLFANEKATTTTDPVANASLKNAIITFKTLGDSLTQVRTDAAAPPTLVSRADQVGWEQAYFTDPEAKKLQDIIKLIDPNAPAINFPAGSSSQDQLQITLKALAGELAKDPLVTNLAANINPAVRAFFNNPTATDAQGLKNLDATLNYFQGDMATSPIASVRANVSQLQTLRNDLKTIAAGQNEDQLAKNGLEPLFKLLLPDGQIYGTSQADRNKEMLSALQFAIQQNPALMDPKNPQATAIASFLKEQGPITISVDAVKAIDALIAQQAAAVTDPAQKTALANAQTAFDALAASR